jgi:hypothetical protein
MASFKQDLAPLFCCACTEDSTGDSHMRDILNICDYDVAKQTFEDIRSRIALPGADMPPAGWVSSCPGLQPEYQDHTWGGDNDPARKKLNEDFEAWVKANFPP